MDMASVETPMNIFSETHTSSRKPLYVSKDFGKTWQDASSNLPDNVQTSFIEPMGDELLLATDNMNLFLSRNNRRSWQQIGNALPNHKINALHISGKDIFVGVYNSGIYKSANNGRSWQSLNFNLPNLRVQAILTLGTIIYVGTDIGIFRLNKSENKWVALFKDIQVLSLAESEGKIVAGTSQGTLLSSDKGQRWQWIHKNGAIHYSIFINEKIIEMYLSGDVFISSDYGSSWKEVEYSPRDRSYTYDVVKAGNFLILSNNYGIHQSKKNNDNWDHIFFSEQMAFFDLLVIDGVIYGGTRHWDEFRGRN